MEEFYIINKGADLFERSSGCCLHRNPKSDKCKILLLGSWISLKQDEIPLPFLKISQFLDMLGVEIHGDYTEYRRKNGDIIVNMVKSKIDMWIVEGR